MKKANKAKATTNYSYTAVKSGKETIIIWDNLAQMMMGNGIPPMGVRILKEGRNKEKK